MKLLLSFSPLVMALCLAHPAANAQNAKSDNLSPWYVGGSIGQSSIKLKTDNINGTLDGQQDTHDTGYRLLGGYQFHPNWAVEGQYFDLGKYRYTESDPFGTAEAVVKTHGFGLSGVGRFPVTPDIALLGKLGVARQTFSAQAVAMDGTRAEFKATATAPLLGFGAEYNLSKNVRLRAEYEYFGVPTVLSRGNQRIKLRTDLLSLGLVYRF